MNDERDETTKRGDEFDRASHKLDRPDVVRTETALVDTTDFYGIVEQWTVRRFSDKDDKERRADTILLTRGKGRDFLRLVIPPEITRVIDRTYDAVTVKKRRKVGREAIERRKEAGEDVGAALRDPKVQAKARAARKAKAARKRGRK